MGAGCASETSPGWTRRSSIHRTLGERQMRQGGPGPPPGTKVVLLCGQCPSVPVTAFRFAFGWGSSCSPEEHGLPARFIYIQVHRVSLAEIVGHVRKRGPRCPLRNGTRPRVNPARSSSWLPLSGEPGGAGHQLPGPRPPRVTGVTKFQVCPREVSDCKPTVVPASGHTC